MSNASIRALKTKKGERGSLALERDLQRVVNALSQALDRLKVPPSALAHFENIFENANSFDDVVGGIAEMAELVVGNIPATSENYENLERVLQQYEGEIREHIRIEQQLKIYAEGLEEQLDMTNRRACETVNRLENVIGERDKLQREIKTLKPVRETFGSVNRHIKTGSFDHNLTRALRDLKLEDPVQGTSKQEKLLLSFKNLHSEPKTVKRKASEKIQVDTKRLEKAKENLKHALLRRKAPGS